MTPEETAALLMWAAGHDRRHEVGSVEEAQIRRRIWAGVLEDVPFDFAREFVDRHYAKVDAPELKPAHVLWAFRTARRVEVSKDREPMLIGETRLRAPEGFIAHVAASTKRWVVARQTRSEAWRLARGEAQEIDAQIPTPWTNVAVDDVRERRCVHHDICVCYHQECRAGWLDGPEPVQRCPRCEEAVMMRSELTPKRGRRR